MGGKNRTQENTGGGSKEGDQKERGPLADVRFGKKGIRGDNVEGIY